jgi:catechol 2,3-dioxygenase-like lactoylglutathione lyase family enzyme
MVAPLSLTADTMEFHSATPILRVADLQASIDHYVDVLGFGVQWRHRQLIACVARGPCALFLAAGDQGHPGAWVWIGVPDVEVLCAHYRARGARIRLPPTNYLWALEMQIEDPDGNVLRFGSDSKPGEPFGDWLDMNGNSWKASQRD